MKPFVAVQIVPTGIGCEIGGFAGDATPATNLLAAACEVLLTHPNAVNAAVMYRAKPNVLYVEGHALDRVLMGQWALRPVRKNRIALVIDRAVSDDPEAMVRITNATHAAMAVSGVEVIGWVATEKPLDLRLSEGEFGATHGEVGNPEVLLAAARDARGKGAEAIALVARMPEVSDTHAEAYAQGQGPDPIGGLEAILSHLVVDALRVPCAHAPYESFEEEGVVDPRVSAETIGLTFLPCILEGLARAPRPVPMAEAQVGDLTVSGVDAVVAPANACGGIPMLAAVERGIPLIAVEGEVAAGGVTPEALGLPALRAANYLEAAGLLLALKEGFSLGAVTRPLSPLRML